MVLTELKYYKKHVAMFFVFLFISSQLAFSFHDLLFEHVHTHFEKELKQDSDSIAVFGNFDYLNDDYNCFLCHQHQTVKLYSKEALVYNIDNSFIESTNCRTYKAPLVSSYLLEYASLRAPPVSLV